ncbi:UDP-glucosyltransferase 2 isoform X2 [Drosophila grimshawi]|uniref:UDP-glucosyltransferase 2 isoform X2 n=1 Tax=Drosophila grimshawi TaxID=7222 RepID=UPI000C8703B5|nr:UDP-glucosyltransferase 2 isoform X2 [Drosophila grimshawi]
MTTRKAEESKRLALIVLYCAVLSGASGGASGAAGVEAGNVLAVFPHFGYSHFKVALPILNELSRRGHHLTVISYVQNPEAPQLANYEQLLLSSATEDQSSTTINVVPLSEHTPTRSLKVLLQEYYDLYGNGQISCELLYASGHVETVLERHKQKPYDLLLTEYFSTDCQLSLAKLLELPIIGLSTCALMPYYYDRIDLPDTPAYVLSEFVGFKQPLSWSERLLNFAQAKLLKLIYRLHTNRADNALIKRHLNLDIDVDAVARNQTAFILGNQHYSHMGSRPRTQQFLEVGGVHITHESQKQLTPKIVQFLQQSKHGIIFISWGSMVRASSIDDDKLTAIIHVLQQLPFNVIWKWEAEEQPKPQLDASKFLFVKWAPQLALLCQPQVRLFWAHAGLLGLTEALHCGKPLLMTPIYGDQFLNAFAAQDRGVGIKLDYQQINVDTLQQSLQELSKPSYAERALKLSQVFNQRERSPLETAIWSVEHVLQHGQLAVELIRSPGIELNWFVYHSLDSLAVILAALLLLLVSCRALAMPKSQAPPKPQRKSRKARRSNT